MATFISHNADETAALGEEWGRTAQPGWVIGLSGDLGAGKTQLIKGFARGLGITARIQSEIRAIRFDRSGRASAHRICAILPDRRVVTSAFPGRNVAQAAAPAPASTFCNQS